LTLECQTHMPISKQRERSDGPWSLKILVTVIMMIAALAAVAPGVAGAVQWPDVQMRAWFKPYRPGGPTTVALGFKIEAAAGAVPPPLTRLAVSFPRGMGRGATNLGEATCSVATLERYGPIDCPPNSFMGRGHAVAETEIAAETFQEPLVLSVLMTTAHDAHTTMLIDAEGLEPLWAEEIFVSELVGAGAGAQLVTNLPLVTVVAGGPYAAVTSFFFTVGPLHLTYYRRMGKALVPYTPRGIMIPARCPRGGYRFVARLAFFGYGSQTRTTTVPCPRGEHRHLRMIAR
jgi:hypothetical protein